jgi:hypothetical protein
MVQHLTVIFDKSCITSEMLLPGQRNSEKAPNFFFIFVEISHCGYLDRRSIEPSPNCGERFLLRLGIVSELRGKMSAYFDILNCF